MGFYFNSKRKLKDYWPPVKWKLQLAISYPRHWIDAHKRKLPDFLMLGAMKAGTTFLFHHLNQHPDVKMSRIQEINYFAKRYHRSLRFYRSFFPLQSDRKLTGESGIYYLLHPCAAQRVKKHLPNAKFIVLMRNPIHRAYSNYNQIKQVDFVKNFDEAIALEKERTSKYLDKIKNRTYYRSIEFEAYSYAARGLYAHQLKYWFEHFPKEQFYFVKSEELFADPQNVFDELHDFLGLSAYKYENIEPQNVRGYEMEMSKETEDYLKEFYREDMLELQKMIGKKFSW